MGVWAQPDRNSELVPQVRRAATKGYGAVAVFAYGDLFTDHRSSRRARGVYDVFVSNSRAGSAETASKPKPKSRQTASR